MAKHIAKDSPLPLAGEVAVVNNIAKDSLLPLAGKVAVVNNIAKDLPLPLAGEVAPQARVRVAVGLAQDFIPEAHLQSASLPPPRPTHAMRFNASRKRVGFDPVPSPGGRGGVIVALRATALLDKR